MSRFKRGAVADPRSGFRQDTQECPVPSGLLKSARKSGHLNLSGRGLSQGKHTVSTLQKKIKEENNHGTLTLRWERVQGCYGTALPKETDYHFGLSDWSVKVVLTSPNRQLARKIFVL